MYGKVSVTILYTYAYIHTYKTTYAPTATKNTKAPIIDFAGAIKVESREHSSTHESTYF